MSKKKKDNNVSLPDDLLRGIRRLKGKKDVKDVDAEESSMEEVFPVSSEIARVKDEKKKAEEAKAKPVYLESKFKIGEFIEGKGVFVGARELKEFDGSSLGEFNVFAAPEDLQCMSFGMKVMVALDLVKISNKSGRLKEGLLNKRLKMTFSDAVERVAFIDNYHGHDGNYYENEAELYEAIRIGRYRGEWFIPNKDIFEENIFPNKDQGHLAGTFDMAKDQSDGSYYWECTEDATNPVYTCTQKITDRDINWTAKSHRKFPTRMVRLEQRL